MTKLYICFEVEPGAADRIYDDEQAAGEPLFKTLVEKLSEIGAKIVGQPGEWDSYGWYVEVNLGDAKLICMMQRSDEWLLMVFAERTLMDRLKGRKFEPQIHAFANLVAEGVHQAFQVPHPVVKTEAEYRSAQ
jgi:hypothetical protein